MKFTRNILALILLCLVVFSFKQEEDIIPDWGTDVECFSGVQLHDTIYLDDSYRPYSDFWANNKIIYKNSGGAELIFTKSQDSSHPFFISGFCDIKCKGLIPNAIKIPLENTSVSYFGSNNHHLGFGLNVSTTPDMTKIAFIDHFIVSYNSNDQNDNYTFLTSLPILYRGITKKEFNALTGNSYEAPILYTVTLGGKKFKDITKLDLAYVNTVLYLSKEYGMVALKDNKNTLWVWDKFVP